jgi:hypothetical protein
MERLHILYLALLNLIKPKGYNPPNCIQMLYNQWLHQGFLWDFYDYEFYSKYTKEVF